MPLIVRRQTMPTKQDCSGYQRILARHRPLSFLEIGKECLPANQDRLGQLLGRRCKSPPRLGKPAGKSWAMVNGRLLQSEFQLRQRDNANHEIVLFGYSSRKLCRNAFTFQQREQIRIQKNAHLNRNR